MRPYRTEREIGADSGGTFIDFVRVGPQGWLQVEKWSSSAAEPAAALAAGLQALKGRAAAPECLVHGTTVATNAILERRFSRAALITTLGFRDVMAIGRQARRDLYSLYTPPVEPLLSRELRLEVAERLDWRGRVLTPLQDDDALAALRQAMDYGAESVAVCLLFAYLNPEHEERIGALAAALGLDVSLSSRVAPVSGEYERTTTTAANALISPGMRRYLAGLEDVLAAQGIRRVRVMQSNGGALTAAEAACLPIRTALSGPAAGVIAAERLARQHGLSDLLTLDMGGTSTDVSLILRGRAARVDLVEAGGMPIIAPVLDIHTIGAGGGSLAWLDDAGALRVGPQSAGADPGPVAYGRSSQLTVTDAHVQIGRLPAQFPLGGFVSIHDDRVLEQFGALGGTLGVSPVRAAEAVIQAANAAMVRALRRMSVERGLDPRRMALMAFGGCGALHACELAAAMEMERVVIPRFPGAFSAIGLLAADVKRDYRRSFPAGLMLDENAGPELQSAADALLQEARGDPAVNGEIEVAAMVAARYQGQSFSLEVPIELAPDPARAAELFHAAHQQRYGYARRGAPVEASALLLEAREVRDPPPLIAPPPEPGAAMAGEAKLLSELGAVPAPILLRNRMTAGQRVEGPVVITQQDATFYLPAGWRAIVEEDGTILAER